MYCFLCYNGNVVTSESNKVIQKISVMLEYDDNINSAWFDQVSLVENAGSCVRYTYDEKGNLVAVSQPNIGNTAMQYEDNNPYPIGYTDADGVSHTFVYDSNYFLLEESTDGAYRDATTSYTYRGNAETITYAVKTEISSGNCRVIVMTDLGEIVEDFPVNATQIVTIPNDPERTYYVKCITESAKMYLHMERIAVDTGDSGMNE